MYDQKIQPPSKLDFWLETRAFLELGHFLLARNRFQLAPKGDGHPVMVLPGFMVGDTSTIPMRSFLGTLGYSVFPWELGSNLGYHDGILDKLVQKIADISKATNQSVSLIGWSLGGIYAREIARAKPDIIRQVMTLGTPFARNLKANNIRFLYEWVSGNRAEDVDPELFARIQRPPPVPTTAIFTQSDGIVAWQTTQEQEESETVQNIGVNGSHCGLGHNVAVLLIIANRLAQPEDEWQPFRSPPPEEPIPPYKIRALQATAHRLESGLTQLEDWLERRQEAGDGCPSHQ